MLHRVLQPRATRTSIILRVLHCVLLLRTNTTCNVARCHVEGITTNGLHVTSHGRSCSHVLLQRLLQLGARRHRSELQGAHAHLQLDLAIVLLHLHVHHVARVRGRALHLGRQQQRQRLVRTKVRPSTRFGHRDIRIIFGDVVRHCTS